MLNLSKITLLLLASIGLTACGLGSLIDAIEKGGDECPLEPQFCDFGEDGEQSLLPPDVNVDASTLQISPTVLGEHGVSSGFLVDIATPTDSPTYEVRYTEVPRVITGSGTEDGFAYYSITTDGAPLQYVGILPTTDLGNAFNYRLSTAAEAKTTWRGTLTLIEGNVVSKSSEFSMEINFTSLQISTPDGIRIPTGTDTSITRTGRLNGDFGVAGQKQRTPGQLTGMFDIIGDTPSPTPMIGLIGEEGAVGVFSGTYFGGFVASP